MKFTPLIRATLLAFALVSTLTSARADITTSTGYSASSIFTGGTSDAIVTYDWDSTGNLYYSTATPDFTFGGLYKYDGVTKTQVVAGSSDFPSQTVVAVGGNVYYNTSDESNTQKIFQYSPTGGTSALVSTTPNWGLYQHNGAIFITGAAGFGTNHIYYAGPDGNGNLFTTVPVVDLGEDSGSSGPLAFDSAGDLYYAPGFGDLSIYKWSASDVAAALANPTGASLSIAGHLWVSYGSDYNSDPNNPTFGGGTSMTVDGNQLFLTLTNFDGPSDLVSFGITNTGTYSDSTSVVLQTSDLIGELNQHDGSLQISDGNQIFDIAAVPEPSSIFLLALGLAGLVYFRFRRAKRLAPVTALIVMFFFSINFSEAQTETLAPAQADVTPVAASDPAIQEWANSVISFTPGPVQITDPTGAKANFGTASNALGPSDATAGNPFPVVSLGDGGSITLSFAQPIANGPGTDFAVYENGFGETGVPNADFLELATVAVSSNGVNFFTFPSVSLTQTTTQVGGFGTLDPSLLYNLAGSALAGFGTPFNLDDLAGVSPLLNINDITQVRITDVIGNINTALGPGTYTYDDASNPIFNGAYGTTNNLINDPYPTNFNTGGFDLDAISVLNVVPEPSSIWYLGLGLIVLIAIRTKISTTQKIKNPVAALVRAWSPPR